MPSVAGASALKHPAICSVDGDERSILVGNVIENGSAGISWWGGLQNGTATLLIQVVVLISSDACYVGSFSRVVRCDCRFCNVVSRPCVRYCDVASSFRVPQYEICCDVTLVAKAELHLGLYS